MSSLYSIALRSTNSYIDEYYSPGKFEFLYLPNKILFDLIYKAFKDEKYSFLELELENNIELLGRLIAYQHGRVRLLKCLQGLIDYRTKENNGEETILEKLTYSYRIANVDNKLGLKIIRLFNEGGWYRSSLEILKRIETNIVDPADPDRLNYLNLKLYTETMYCQYSEAYETLVKITKIPHDFAEVHGNIANYYHRVFNYKESYKYAISALNLLTDSHPPYTKIDVLRHASRACIAMRQFRQACLLITNALHLGELLYKYSTNRDLVNTSKYTEFTDLDGNCDLIVQPQFADILIDFGYYLLKSQYIRGCIMIYRKALMIRKTIFGNWFNLQTALVYENLAYPLYLDELSSRFFENAEIKLGKAINLYERILPRNHYYISSVKFFESIIMLENANTCREATFDRMKALQPNEPLDIYKIDDEANYMMEYAEELHQEALKCTKKTFGENNLRTAKCYGNLGRLYQNMGRLEEAEKMHLLAIRITTDLFGENHSYVAKNTSQLAFLYNFQMDRYHEAETLYLRTIEIYRNSFGRFTSHLGIDYTGMIRVYMKVKDEDKCNQYKSLYVKWYEGNRRGCSRQMRRRSNMKIVDEENYNEYEVIENIQKQFVEFSNL